MARINKVIDLLDQGQPVYITHTPGLDYENGKELWSHKLPYIGSAPPTSYEVNGEQYIIVPASGGISLKFLYPELVEQGDAFVAFKIQD